MFSHLLIPLDGSHLAEAALPPTITLAHLLQAPVTLIHVIEHHAPKEVHGEHHLTGSEEAWTYLEEVAARFPPDIQVESHVHTSEVSDVARSIVDHVGELESDLIVMCTHGRGGLRSWLFGSIAQQVLLLGTSPVLLVHPDKAGIASPFRCRRLLIPLDGDPEHEQGLPVAAQSGSNLPGGSSPGDGHPYAGYAVRGTSLHCPATAQHDVRAAGHDRTRRGGISAPPCNAASGRGAVA